MVGNLGHSSTESLSILIVEDDDNIAEPLIEGLSNHGFNPVRAKNAQDAFNLIHKTQFVLLDLGLPDLDGTEVCRRIRRSSDIPIIVVTARDDEIDRVQLLELGADDYLIKPFSFRELVARIGAVQRRSVPSGATTVENQRLGSIEIDRSARRVWVNGAEVDLTPKEYDLLAYLASEPGVVRTREAIISSVWDEFWWGPTNTLDVHIAALRRKLGQHNLIVTLRGVGYRLDVEGE